MPRYRSVRLMGSFCACILLRHFPAEEHRRKMASCSLPAHPPTNTCGRPQGLTPCGPFASRCALGAQRLAWHPIGVVVQCGDYSSPVRSGVVVLWDSIRSIPSFPGLPSPSCSRPPSFFARGVCLWPGQKGRNLSNKIFFYQINENPIERAVEQCYITFRNPK